MEDPMEISSTLLGAILALNIGTLPISIGNPGAAPMDWLVYLPEIPPDDSLPPFDPGDGEPGGGGGCVADFPSCNHACDHPYPGVSGCPSGGNGVCTNWDRSRENTTRRQGDYVYRIIKYYGGQVSDNDSSYYCCKANITHDHHSGFKYCPI